MQTIKVELADDAAKRLSQEAARRNVRVEEVAARILHGQLPNAFAEEFFTTDAEADSYAAAVRDYRDSRRREVE